MPTVKTARPEPENSPELRARARQLGLWGLLAQWDEIHQEPWLPSLIEAEETERQRRSLERRLRTAKLGRFKPVCDFDWSWPEEIDRELLDEVFTLSFLAEPANVVLVGSNGVGKTMIAKNIAHHAILHGHTARFTTASALLNDLSACDTGSALTRRLRHYCHPQLLVIDEVGYLSTSADHADLLFEVVSQRYHESSIVLTTNKPFREWNKVFPSSNLVVPIIDRLVHRAEIVNIVAESYRRKEAEERAEQREKARRRKKAPKKKAKTRR